MVVECLIWMRGLEEIYSFLFVMGGRIDGFRVRVG
jgi:hypothetical protein